MPKNHIPGEAGELKSLHTFGMEEEKTMVA